MSFGNNNDGFGNNNNHFGNDHNNFDNDPNSFGSTDRVRSSDPTSETTDFSDSHLGQVGQAQQDGVSETQRGSNNNDNPFDNPTSRGGAGFSGSTAYPGDTQAANVPGTAGNPRTGFGRSDSGTQWDDNNNTSGSTNSFGRAAGRDQGYPGSGTGNDNNDSERNRFESSNDNGNERTAKPSMTDRLMAKRHFTCGVLCELSPIVPGFQYFASFAQLGVLGRA
ncbi:hypothetical protein BXZ70DRAFT_953872 [Cristinia sonorae]|uniref:Uncharacterized protein n=1 Tax=Cristinia sonorae TaxID=1940300 RepID=A0A8K0UGL4_9AGAR|nr:hypothetical protein BXZ70DRAFT_953872 [Cristinia sonorae]